MYATRRCTHGVPTVYPYPQYPWLTQPEGRRVRVLTGTGTGQPGITRGLPVLIPENSTQSLIGKMVKANLRNGMSNVRDRHIFAFGKLYWNKKCRKSCRPTLAR